MYYRFTVTSVLSVSREEERTRHSYSWKYEDSHHPRPFLSASGHTRVFLGRTGPRFFFRREVVLHSASKRSEKIDDVVGYEKCIRMEVVKSMWLLL